MRFPAVATTLVAAVALTGCWHSERSLTAANAAVRVQRGRLVGERGFGTRETVDGAYYVVGTTEIRVTRVGNAAVALPPDAPAGFADLVWRSSDDGVALCHTAPENPVCVIARYGGTGAPLEPRAMFLDPVNHGSVQILTRSVNQGAHGRALVIHAAAGHVEAGVRYPATVTGGVWALADRLAWCDVEGPANRPVCRAVPSAGTFHANVLAVQVMARGGPLHDVVWFESDDRITRCEAGPDAPTPTCAPARLPIGPDVSTPEVTR